MRRPNIVGDNKPTEIKYKKEKIERVQKNGIIETTYKDTNIPILGHQGGKKLKSRVLFPEEVLAIIKVLEDMGKSAKDDLTNFKMCLLLGARYEESKWIQLHSECYDKESRNIIYETKKVKVEYKKRKIRLSNLAMNEIGHFFTVDKYLPTQNGWDKKLKYYARLAGITDEGVSSRMMRKTYESWLMFYFPERKYEILQSQGHKEITAFEHYLKTDFIEKDRQLMKEFVEGWI